MTYNTGGLVGGIALISSRTFWAQMIGLAAMVATSFGFIDKLGWLSDPSLIDKIVQFTGMIAMIAGMFFRTVATQQVTGIVKAK